MTKPGPKPLPTSTLRLRGSWRAHKHLGRMDAVPAVGVPERPGDLCEAAGELWDRIITEHEHRGTLAGIDTAALTALCECWGLYRAALVTAKDDPCDKAARCAVLGYLAEVNKLASKFGWTPADRASIKPPAAPQETKRLKPRNRA